MANITAMLNAHRPLSRSVIARVLAVVLLVFLSVVVSAPMSDAQNQDDGIIDTLDENLFEKDKAKAGEVDQDILTDTKSFFDTGLGKMLVQVARVMAILLAIFAVLKFGAAFFSRNQAGGGLGRALGPAAIAFIAAGFLMNLGWTAALLSWFTSIVGKVFEAIGELIF